MASQPSWRRHHRADRHKVPIRTSSKSYSGMCNPDNCGGRGWVDWRMSWCVLKRPETPRTSQAPPSAIGAPCEPTLDDFGAQQKGRPTDFMTSIMCRCARQVDKSSRLFHYWKGLTLRATIGRARPGVQLLEGLGTYECRCIPTQGLRFGRHGSGEGDILGGDSQPCTQLIVRLMHLHAGCAVRAIFTPRSIPSIGTAETACVRCKIGLPRIVGRSLPRE